MCQKISLRLLTKKSQNKKLTLKTPIKIKYSKCKQYYSFQRTLFNIPHMFAPFKSVTENLVQTQKFKNLYLTTQYSNPCLFCHTPQSLTEPQK